MASESLLVWVAVRLLSQNPCHNLFLLISVFPVDGNPFFDRSSVGVA